MGLYHGEAKHLLSNLRILVEQRAGEVPRSRAALEALPGVGRTGQRGAERDLRRASPHGGGHTHIFRVSNRTGLAPGKTPLEVEMKLLKRIPPPTAWMRTTG